MSGKRIGKAKKSTFDIFANGLNAGGGVLILTLLALIFASCSSDDGGNVAITSYSCGKEESGNSGINRTTNTYDIYDLEGLLKWKSDYSGDSVDAVLHACIDMAGQEWSPIGTNTSDTYDGTFDGGNHILSNLSISSSNSGVGFIGFLGSNGEVNNLILWKPSISLLTNGYAGGIVGYSEGKVHNCELMGGEITADTSGSIIGGIVGQAGQASKTSPSVTTCINSATVSLSTTGNAGGIVGDNYGTVETCTNDGIVQNTANNVVTYVGGIVGVNRSSGDVLSCTNKGEVSAGTGSSHVGGIAGGNVGNVADTNKNYTDIDNIGANSL